VATCVSFNRLLCHLTNVLLISTCNPQQDADFEHGRAAASRTHLIDVTEVGRQICTKILIVHRNNLVVLKTVLTQQVLLIVSVGDDKAQERQVRRRICNELDARRFQQLAYLQTAWNVTNDTIDDFTSYGFRNRLPFIPQLYFNQVLFIVCQWGTCQRDSTRQWSNGFAERR
jgi:hypothetical protein